MLCSSTCTKNNGTNNITPKKSKLFIKIETAFKMKIIY